MVVAAPLAISLSSCSSVFPAPSRSLAGESRQSVRPVVRREVSGLPRSAGEQVDIWLVADPLHTGVVLPLAWLEEFGFMVPPGVRGAEYVNLSWGDRVAYEQERWLTPLEVMTAFFTPTESVMEIVAVDYDPRWVFPKQRLYRASISRGTGASVAAFLNHCRGELDGEPGWKVIGGPTWGRGHLLACPHSYGFPRLCNSWTAGALASCGLNFGPWARIWGNSLIRRAQGQGFEEVPALTPLEQELLARYLASGEGGGDVD